MQALATLLLADLTGLCGALQVTPDSLTRGRRGNLPPPSGGVGSF